MKGVTKFYTTTIFTLFIFLFVNNVYAQYPVSGTVRYSDNYEPISSGTVQAYDLACNLIATASINENGTYDFSSLPPVSMDIIAFPDMGPEDDCFVPTVHPDKTDWQSATPVCPSSPLSGIDIFVQRIEQSEYNASSFIRGKVYLNNSAVANAIVYAKMNDMYYGFGTTDANGNYEIKSLPQGDYILVVHRIGASSATRNVNLTMEGLTNVIFNLEEAPFILYDTAPKDYELQNYPNPFNPETKINYVIPVSGQVKLSVYNTLGQLVSLLVNEVQTSGSYSVSFNGSGLSSGVYIYRLEAGSFIQTRKMILLK